MTGATNFPFQIIDPETRIPLMRASEQALAALRTCIASGHARRRDGQPIPTLVEGAYLSEDGRIAYVDVDAIPSFIAEEALELTTPIDPRD